MAMWVGLKEEEVEDENEKLIKITWPLMDAGKETMELELKQSQVKQLWDR